MLRDMFFVVVKAFSTDTSIPSKSCVSALRIWLHRKQRKKIIIVRDANDWPRWRLEIQGWFCLHSACFFYSKKALKQIKILNQMFMQKYFLWFLFHLHRDLFNVLEFLASCLWLLLVYLPATLAAQHLLQKCTAQHMSRHNHGSWDKKASFVCRVCCFASGWLTANVPIWLRKRQYLIMETFCTSIWGSAT